MRPSDPHHVHRVIDRGTLPPVSAHVHGPRLTQTTGHRLQAVTLLCPGTERAGVDR